METDTNPIDRSIAHLLFHRPSDPSATAPFDTLSVKSHTNIVCLFSLLMFVFFFLLYRSIGDPCLVDYKLMLGHED